MARTFTPDEANRALAEVRPLVESMVRHRRALLAAQARRAATVAVIAGNGGAMAPSELAELAHAVEREEAALGEALLALERLGVQVKDLDAGLVDFPARRGDEKVLLCWQLGEPAVAWWHRLEDGFAGRRPLPLD